MILLRNKNIVSEMKNEEGINWEQGEPVIKFAPVERLQLMPSETKPIGTYSDMYSPNDHQDVDTFPMTYPTFISAIHSLKGTTYKVPRRNLQFIRGLWSTSSERADLFVILYLCS